MPIMPIIYRLEYDIGYWLLHQPHRLPPGLRHHSWNIQAWLNWANFVQVGAPLLVGSLIVGIPIMLLAFISTKVFLERMHWNRKT